MVDPLRVLIIGAGGREHALAWRIAQSTRVERVYVAPGNGGTTASPKTQTVSISGEDFPALVRFAVDNEVRINSLSRVGF